ncbi:MAG: pilus assembly protein HicB [Bacteroidales bacterium]|nr:pilus assembly protein HicB [Bacteroidales bacterium]
MLVKAIIERGEDGLYSVYSSDHIGKSYFGGFGESVVDAKADFMVSIQEAIKEENAAIDPTCVEVEYHYDIPSFFNCFDFINVSKFAELAGINESKMRAYKSGVAFPGEKTMAKISNAVRKIGIELSSAGL